MKTKVEEKSESMKCVFNFVENNLATITLYKDEATRPSASADIESMIRDSVFERSLIFDCSNIQYICSEEIGWLLQCHRSVSKNGGSLVLHSVSGFAIETLRLMKLDSVLAIVGSAGDAVSAVADR